MAIWCWLFLFLLGHRLIAQHQVSRHRAHYWCKRRSPGLRSQESGHKICGRSLPPVEYTEFPAITARGKNNNNNNAPRAAPDASRQAPIILTHHLLASSRVRCTAYTTRYAVWCTLYAGNKPGSRESPGLGLGVVVLKHFSRQG